ncbi:MAG: hypothetical protein KQ78_00019 [Candidatus Izimaplasma bacterium HR2]|nr:MAG: hypothetical protein KQ78_00019 [Candidatus Izimaplasma bacterium HR2]
MGSFDMSCALSGISLGMRQPTKMFFIIKSDYDWSLCNPTNLYKFCSFGVDMTYDDYGRYEFDENQPAWKEFVCFIQKNSMYVEEGENPYHEKEFNPKNSDHLKPDYLFDMMYHNRVIVKVSKKSGGGCKEQMTIHPYPIHKRVFDDICLKPFNGYNGVVYDANSINDEIRERIDINDKIRERIERIVDIHQTKVVSGEMSQEKADEIINSIQLDFDRYNPFSVGIYESFYHNYSFVNFIKKYGLDEFWLQIGQICMMNHILYNNRIMVQPQMSSGQEYCYEKNIDFHQECVNIITEIKHVYDENYKCACYFSK